jgi:AcrR family transcriptional regulator
MATEEAVTGTRAHILAAAEQLIRDRGLKATTTRAIAEIAKCAEGSIYRYFPDKHAIIHEIVRTRFPEFLTLVQTLPERAGTGTVRRNLEELAVGALGFYRVILPITFGVMADRELLEEQRRHFAERKTGPMKFIGAVAAYLSGERRLGRISEKAPPEPAARLLLGACFSQASVEALLGEEARIGTDEQFARDVVRTLMEGLEPAKGVKTK